MRGKNASEHLPSSRAVGLGVKQRHVSIRARFRVSDPIQLESDRISTRTAIHVVAERKHNLQQPPAAACCEQLPLTRESQLGEWEKIFIFGGLINFFLRNYPIFPNEILQPTSVNSRDVTNSNLAEYRIPNIRPPI